MVSAISRNILRLVGVVMAARDGFLLPGRVLADGPGALRTKLVMPVERHPQHFWPTLVRRGVWLAGLMILQSIRYC